MSLYALERTLRTAHPACVRVNLRLWYELRSANLIAQREVSPRVEALSGVLFPHIGGVLLVLDPDLDGRAFEVAQPAKELGSKAVPPRIQGAGSQGSNAASVDTTDSPLDRRWMGRY